MGEKDARPTQDRLSLLAAVFTADALDAALTQGARLLAQATSSEHAALFLADGNEPLREFWFSESSEERERIRAAFKGAALEAARTGSIVTPPPVAIGDRSIQPRALPLSLGGRTLGAVCFLSIPGKSGGEAAREREIGAIAGMLAYRAGVHEEIARFRAQRARDERWFKTLDSHLRVLDRERQKFAAFVNQTDTFVYVMDETGAIRWNNRAMSDLFPPGESDPSWLGKRCRDVCSRLGRTCPACPAAQAMERRQVVHHELRTERGGTAGLLYFTALPIIGPNGRTDEVLVMVQDLTGLDGLRRSESRYRLLFERNVDGIVMVDPESHRIVLANTASCAMLGFTLEELLERKLPDLHAPEEWKRLRERYSESLANESRVTGECTVRARSGEERHVHIWATRLTVEGQDVLMVNFRDISEQRRAERALRDAETRRGAILDTAIDCIITIDHEGRVTEFNPAAERTFGYTRSEAVGRELAELIIPATMRAAHRKGLARYLKSGTGPVIGRRIETTAMRADATEFPVELAIARVPGSEPPTFTGYIRDLTERKETEVALRRSEEQLRQAQKMEAVGVLAGGVAHDFNNLLTVIMMQSELLLRSLPVESPARAKAEEIHTASARGAILTRQLLTFSRNEVLAPEVLDMNVVVSDMEEMLRRLIGEDVEVTCALAPRPAPIRADRGQAEQVVMNLAVNARDAMPGGGRLRVEVGHVRLDEASSRELNAAGPGPYCTLTVEDTGCGMDQETQQRIFEPFFTTKERGKGTGLGLSTVYGIANQAGGSISVRSAPGKGATFTVYFPVVESVPEEEEAARLPGMSRGSETILLVEDEPGVRMIGRELLQINGYRVLEAEDGVQALEVAARFPGPIHLLVTDVVMPRMGGRDLAQRMLVQRPGTRILFVSGFTDDMVVRHGVLDEGMAFLQKPFSLESLSQKVREVLDGSAPAKATDARH